MDHLFDDFFPILEQAGIEVKRHLFDLHFYRLTTCTHQGAVALGNREMQICDELLKKIEWSYEDLEYLLSYKLRKVEQQKNSFDFKGALETLTGMEMLLKESLKVITMVNDLGEFTKNIKSKMLGKVLGSKVAVESYLLDEMPELKEWILLDSDKAIIQFTEPADITRQYQTRAMAEYRLGNYENAVKALKKAAGVTDDNLMMLVRTFKEKKDEFGLMHYANIMALATAEGLQLGDERDTQEMAKALTAFYAQESIVITKKTKRGVGQSDIRPAVRDIAFTAGEGEVRLHAVISAQEPTLNPALLADALRQLRPDIAPDF